MVKKRLPHFPSFCQLLHFFFPSFSFLISFLFFLLPFPFPIFLFHILFHILGKMREEEMKEKKKKSAQNVRTKKSLKFKKFMSNFKNIFFLNNIVIFFAFIFHLIQCVLFIDGIKTISCISTI